MGTLFTIGYEGTDIERFVQTLRHVGIELLVDVRAVALSRKKGFSKTALSRRCIAEGIGYEHLIDLGDPKEGREAARAQRYDDFRRVYTAHLSQPATESAIALLGRLIAERPTCLMCFERDPLTCHRSMIGETLKGPGLSVFHLFGDSPSRYIRHAAKLPGRHSGQGAAAA